MSAVHGPGLSLALVAGDETTVARVEGRLRLAAGRVSGLLQALVVALLGGPGRREEVIAAGPRLRLAPLGPARRAAHARVPGHRSHRAGRSGCRPRTRRRRSRACSSQGWLVAPGARCRLRSAPGLRVGLAGLGGADLGRLADDLRDAVGV